MLSRIMEYPQVTLWGKGGLISVPGSKSGGNGIDSAALMPCILWYVISSTYIQAMYHYTLRNCCYFTLGPRTTVHPSVYKVSAVVSSFCSLNVGRQPIEEQRLADSV